MSAPPPQSARSSAAADSAAGSKRRANDSIAASATADEHQSSTMSDDALAAAATPPHSQQSTSADAGSSSSSARKKQKRASSPVFLEPAAPVSAAPFTRWSTLYTDALHFIFKFATLRDLTCLMSVSRGWSEAVTTMPPIAAPVTIVNESHLRRVLYSRARRHVSSLQHRNTGCPQAPLAPHAISSIATLLLVSARASWLTHLRVSIVASQTFLDETDILGFALSRFNRLRDLNVRVSWFDAIYEDVDPNAITAACNRLITAIGGLNPQTMRSLSLDLPPQSDEISFAPLAALTELHDFRFSFEFDDENEEPPPLTDAQISELRQLTSVEELRSPYETEDFLTRMLQPCHAFNGGQSVWVNDELAAVLGSLPTLTSLTAYMLCSAVQFFSQLRALTAVDLVDEDASVDPDDFVAALRDCTQLTELKLDYSALTAQHLEDLLPAFPQLCTLSLDYMYQLESLRCFSTPALAASLHSLVLRALPLCPPAELVHLHGLRSLSCVIVSSLESHVGARQRAAFRPGSPRFPSLWYRMLDGNERIEV